MNKILQIQQKIVPELIELLERRYTILQNLKVLQPIGRRGLASKIGLPERLIRNEIDLFKQLGLISVDGQGVWVTKEGQNLLEELKEIVHEASKLSELEAVLQKRLNINRVIVVSGDSDENPVIKKEIGRMAARYLLEHLNDSQIIAITGGSTALELAEATPYKDFGKRLTVVPARGGLGEDVELQANSIAAKLAKKLKANYKLLYVPENLEEESVRLLLLDPKIKQIIELISRANILIHGIGEAEQMARRREVDDEELQLILSKGSVGEAFGYYFNSEGDIVHSTTNIGLGFEDLSSINHIVAIAGGSRKAKAILAVLSKGSQDVLITDEGAARSMVSILRP